MLGILRTPPHGKERIVVAVARLLLGDALDEVDVMLVEVGRRFGGLALPGHRCRAPVVVRMGARRRRGVVHGGGGRSGVQAVVVVSVVLVIVVVVKSEAGLRFQIQRRGVVMVVFIDNVRLDRMARVVVVVRLFAVITAVRILMVMMLDVMRRLLFVGVVVVIMRLQVRQKIVYFCQQLLVAN